MEVQESYDLYVDTLEDKFFQALEKVQKEFDQNLIGPNEYRSKLEVMSDITRGLVNTDAFYAIDAVLNAFRVKESEVKVFRNEASGTTKVFRYTYGTHHVEELVEGRVISGFKMNPKTYFDRLCERILEREYVEVMK